MPITQGTTSLKRLMLGTTTIQKVFQGTVQIWANEVVVVLGAGLSSIVLVNFFTAAQWGDVYLKKRVVNPAGNEIGASNATYAVAATGSAAGQPGSWAGELVFENRGVVSGIGGPANSGKGGDVIWVNFPGRNGEKLNIINPGTIRAGGGGGGRGGNGGPGQYPYTANENGTYNRDSCRCHVFGGQQRNMIWYGTWVRDGAAPNGTSVTVGIYTYYQGGTAEQVGNNYYTYIYRQWTAYQPTNGGVGGNGGRGQGFDGGSVAGSAGTAGGTNAGSGNGGGAGGAYGNAGVAGGTGSGGNLGAGTAGAAPGLAGFYLNGAAYANMNNTGTLLGRVA